MANRELSPREEQIVGLCVDGHTNEAIGQQLGLSVGTVNTYWVRIKLKVGGLGRTDTVVRIIKERAEIALRAANIEKGSLAEMVAEKEQSLLELRAALALFNLAMDQIKSTVWATDTDLKIEVLANGEYPSTHFGVQWVVGKTVYEIFKTSDKTDLAIAAHLQALAGIESEVRLTKQFANMFLRVKPLRDEGGEVMGTIGIMNSVGEDPGTAPVK